MINFRFHLVSLVAVFLALTVGIVVGATIVKPAIVTSLNHQIDRVQKNADTQRDLNKQLSATNNQQDQFLKGAAPFIVQGRLTAVPTVVLAEQGIDRTTVRDLVTLLQQSGAQSPAIVWMQPKWLLKTASDRSKLATITGDTATSAQLRVDGLRALADRLGKRVQSTSEAGTTTTTAEPSGDVLEQLTTAGFLTIDPVGASGTNDLSTFPTPGPRVIVLGGGDSDLVANPVVEPLASAFSALDVPTVAGELDADSDAQPARGTTLATIVGNNALDHSVSTVDDVDLVQGQVAVVLATEDSGRAQFGHYGYGKGADRALPSWTAS